MGSLTDREHTDTADKECGCCPTDAAAPTGSGEPYGCHERKTVLTYREERVLKRIREAHRRAKVLKERILALAGEEAGAVEEKDRALRELEELRNLRRELEEERLAAAEERMRLLGHI